MLHPDWIPLAVRENGREIQSFTIRLRAGDIRRAVDLATLINTRASMPLKVFEHLTYR
jgi:hypothetical protein